LESIWKS